MYMTFKNRVRPIAKLVEITGSPDITWQASMKVLVVVLTAYVLITLISGISTMRAANSITTVGIGSTLSSGPSGLDNLEDKLKTFDRRIGLLKFWISPITRSAKILFFVPYVDRQSKAVDLLLERVDIDSDAAQATLTLGRSMFELKESALSGTISISKSDELSDLKSDLVDLRSDSRRVIEILDGRLGAQAEIKKLDPHSLLRSFDQRMSAQEIRLEQIASFYLHLSNVLLADILLVQNMNATFDELSGFVNGEMAISEVSAVIADLATQTSEANTHAVLMVETAPPGVLDTEYGKIVTTLAKLNQSVDGLIRSIDTVFNAIGGSIDTLGATEQSLFAGSDALANTLNTLVDKEDSLRAAISSMEENVVVLLELDDNSLISLGSLGDVLEQRIEPILQLSSTITSSPRVAGEVFGIDGSTKKYLVLGQTSDELRAAGGFTSSVWLLTFRYGSLIKSEYFNVARIDDLYSPDQYPLAAASLQLHMDAGQMYMRDVGWNPHFPNVGKLAAELFEINHDVKLDGVIALTQWAFVDLVSVLGGLDQDDVLTTIEDGTDKEGTGFLESSFDALLDSLDGETLKTGGVAVLRRIVTLFDSRDLMIYTRNSEIQDIISDNGWSGEMPVLNHDRLAIVDSNVGWNKVDRNIVRSFKYQVDLSDLNMPKAELQLEYENRSTVDDNYCGIQAHVPGVGYQQLANDCYWNLLRVYTAFGSELEDSDPLPLREGAIAARVVGLPAGSGTVQQMHDDNGTYVSGLLTVEPDSTGRAWFSYSLPTEILTRNGENIEYRLDVIVQAGTRGRNGVVSVILPVGHEIIEAENIVEITTNLIEFTIRPDANDVFKLVFRESS
jgi:hypothetical protein